MVAAQGLSLVAERFTSFVLRCLLSLASLVSEHGAPEYTRFSSSAHRLVTLRYVGSSWTRDGTRVRSIGSRFLTTWEALHQHFLKYKDKHCIGLVENVIFLQKRKLGTSLVVQWLRLCASTAGGAGLIPGQGSRIPYAVQCGPKINKSKENLTSFSPTNSQHSR